MLQASFDEFLIFLQNHVILAALMIDLYHVTLKNIKMKEKTDLAVSLFHLWLIIMQFEQVIPIFLIINKKKKDEKLLRIWLIMKNN